MTREQFEDITREILDQINIVLYDIDDVHTRLFNIKDLLGKTINEFLLTEGSIQRKINES